jgi:hypothetical protein
MYDMRTYVYSRITCNLLRKKKALTAFWLSLFFHIGRQSRASNFDFERTSSHVGFVVVQLAPGQVFSSRTWLCPFQDRSSNYFLS